MLGLLLTLSFIAVLFGSLTGILLLPFPENKVVKLLHNTSGPLSNFLFGIYFILFQFHESGPNQRIVLTLCFVLLLYTGIVTGKSDLPRNKKILHSVLGVVTLLLFSFVFFTFILLWTGLAASITEFLG